MCQPYLFKLKMYTMPKYIQLYRDNQPLLGMDGVMKVDGRFNLSSIRQTIIDRNKRMVKTSLIV